MTNLNHRFDAIHASNGFPFVLNQYKFVEKKDGDSKSTSWYSVIDIKFNTNFVASVVDTQSPEWNGQTQLCDECISQLQKVSHPYLIKLYNYFNIDGFLVLISQKYDSSLGQNLVKNGPMKPQLISQIIAKLLESIVYCHSNQISIQNIRPSNILFDQMMNPSLSNFGFAVQLTPQFASQLGVGGIMPYIAPEVLTGKCQDYYKADIWSLAVTIHSMATGRTPWSANDAEGMKDQIVSSRFSMPEDIDHELQTLLMTMMKPNPDQRPSAEDLQLESFFNKTSSKKMSHSTRAISISRLRNNSPDITKKVTVDASIITESCAEKNRDEDMKDDKKGDKTLAKMHSFRLTPDKRTLRGGRAKKIHTSSGHYPDQNE